MAETPIDPPRPSEASTADAFSITGTTVNGTTGDDTTDIIGQDQALSSKDVSMLDAPAESAASPVPTPNTNNPTPTPANAPSPMPARTGTPMRNGEGGGGGSGSRAASAHPDPGFTMPTEAAPHGAPVRQYLNSKVTAVLLEGMKQIAKEQPKDPLRVLGEFLIQRSKELEGTS